MGREVVLKEALTSIENDFDVMLIDCPPSLGVLTINALAACDEVMIPLQAQFFALQGLSKLLDTVMLVQQRINRKLIVGGVLLCMHESTTRLGAEVVADLTQFLDGVRGSDVPWADACLYRTRIRRNIKLAEASSFGQTAIEYAPHCNGASDYAAFARELMGMPPKDEVPASAASVVDSADESANEEYDRIVLSSLPREPVAQQTADEKPSQSDTPVRFEPQELVVPATSSAPSAERFHARPERIPPTEGPLPADPSEPAAARSHTHGETPLDTAPTDPRTS